MELGSIAVIPSAYAKWAAAVNSSIVLIAILAIQSVVRPFLFDKLLMIIPIRKMPNKTSKGFMLCTFKFNSNLQRKCILGKEDVLKRVLQGMKPLFEGIINYVAITDPAIL